MSEAGGGGPLRSGDFAGRALIGGSSREEGSTCARCREGLCSASLGGFVPGLTQALSPGWGPR